MLKLTNIMGGQIVCDLATKGKTLRLDDRQSETINDNEITPHILHLEECELILIEEVSVVETPKETKKTTAKKSSKEKEE